MAAHRLISRIGWRGVRAVCVSGSLVLAACSSDGSEPAASVPVGTDFVDEADDFTEAPSNTDFVPEEDVVETGTVVLGDDVIIGTEDGQVPTTTTEPSVEGTPDELPDAAEPTTTPAPVPLPEPAAVGRIVSLSPTHTETLFALGLGEFVVAVDGESNYPAETVSVRRDDLDSGSADLTVLLELDPDVVILGEDPTNMAGRLDAAGVASYVGPPATSIDDVYVQIADVAAIVGRPDAADELVAQMQGDIDEIVGAVPAGSFTFFHEIDPSLFTITADGFLPSVYGLVGLTNIMDTSGGEPFGQATNDEVLAANPSVIVLADADCCGVTIDVIAARPGWGNLSAVQNGAVVELDDDIASRWGPRAVDLVRAIGGAVSAVA